jgi:hypothetical protein
VIKPIKNNIAIGCRRAVLGRVFVRIEVKILLKSIKPNDINPISEPNTAVIKGRTPVTNRSTTAAMLPRGEPNARQSDF